MMPRRVLIALGIAFFCHGFFILTARYRLSYDAYTHMLFADHYAENWFSLWETRWYAGFTVVSYPPLVHQLIAIFIRMLGFDRAFALILWAVTSLYPLGIYAFARIFTGKTSASYAALASAILLPIYVTAHIFGQLPFLAGTLLALFSAASLDRYLREGGIHNFLLTVSLYTTTMAAHHATLLVEPFLLLAVIAKNFFNHGDTETLRKLSLHAFVSSPIIPRLLFFAVITALASFLVIFPFWGWGAHQTMQTPIDHLSRHNFFTDPLALAIFFLPLYGPLLVVIPFLFRKWHPRLIGLLGAFSILFTLGLGGTTSLPHILFGNSWEWLTYDRFAFWASLTLTPFFGILFIRLKKGIRLTSPTIPAPLRNKWLLALTFFLFALTAIGSWFTPFVFPLQPAPLDMRPIVNFLNIDDNSQWRYLTFGFGDQFAYLNLLARATTIDGSYHTARTIPALRTSGVGQIDTSYWAQNGMNAIKPILRSSGDYGVRWGFVNQRTVETIQLPHGVIRRSPFISVLENLGWVKRSRLSNGVLLYENPRAILPQPFKAPTSTSIVSFSWGVFPILSLVTTLALGGLRVYPVEAERVLRSMHVLAIGLLPISLCFWIYQPIFEMPHDRVYFTYSDALFYFSDAVALLAIIAWALVKIIRVSHLKLPVSPFLILLASLFLLSTFSLFWSRDWRVSLYISLHLGFIFLLILSLREWLAAWKTAMFGLCAALSIEIIIGLIGFAFQSTAFLQPLDMKWPGILNPQATGASVVPLANGLRILRAYGTLPHPNILGGLTFLSVLGPASLFLIKPKPNYLALLLFSLGILLLGLTFSRSAWLAMIAFILIIIWKSKYLNRKRVILFLTASTMTFILTLLPYRELVRARTTDTTSHSEAFSLIGRAWLTTEALQMIREHPLTGVGTGSFIIELSQRAGEGYVIEPVHNLLLLAGSELGIFGLLLTISLFICIALSMYKAQRPEAILAGATVAGLGVISLFDHYLWTVAPGRVLLGLALGLWIGQNSHDA